MTARETALCERASHFDWIYTTAFALGFVGSIHVNIDKLKHTEEPGLRLLGPGLIGFTWGGFLSGGYLSLPKCDPTWSYAPPREGNVRAMWPLATTLAITSAVMAPIMDYTFLGPIKPDWPVGERSLRIFVAAGAGILGSLFPYVLPPRTWAAAKEIERLRIEGMPGGAQVSYGTTF
jgi:hypothetical protein